MKVNHRRGPHNEDITETRETYERRSEMDPRRVHGNKHRPSGKQMAPRRTDGKPFAIRGTTKTVIEVTTTEVDEEIPFQVEEIAPSFRGLSNNETQETEKLRRELAEEEEKARKKAADEERDKLRREREAAEKEQLRKEKEAAEDEARRKRDENEAKLRKQAEQNEREEADRRKREELEEKRAREAEAAADAARKNAEEERRRAEEEEAKKKSEEEAKRKAREDAEIERLKNLEDPPEYTEIAEDAPKLPKSKKKATKKTDEANKNDHIAAVPGDQKKNGDEEAATDGKNTKKVKAKLKGGEAENNDGTTNEGDNLHVGKNRKGRINPDRLPEADAYSSVRDIWTIEKDTPKSSLGKVNIS